MSDHAADARLGESTRVRAPEQEAQPAARRESWAPSQGWIPFGGVLLVLAGAFNIVVGLTGMVRDTVFVSTPNGTLFFDLTTWSWVHFVVGLIQVIVAISLFRRANWALAATVAIAGINAFAMLTFLPFAPIWSTIVIALDVLVIWAVVVHGEEYRQPQHG